MDRDDDYADKEAQLVEEAYVYLITKYPTESAEGELNPLGGEGSDGDQQGVAEPPKKQRKVSGDQSWGARGLGLDEDDHNIILNHKWLTDKHMNACSTLLKRANPSQSGLHHTITLAQTDVQARPGRLCSAGTHQSGTLGLPFKHQLPSWCS